MSGADPCRGEAPVGSGGDLTLRLNGDDVRLRPTFAALKGLEQESGMGLVTLARRFADGTFTLNDCVAVIRAGMQGAGAAHARPDEVGDWVVKAGVALLAGPLASFLQAALTGQDVPPPVPSSS